MFNSIEINSDSQYKLLNIEESQYCDVKSEMIDPSKLSQTISAFANTSTTTRPNGRKTNITTQNKENETC